MSKSKLLYFFNHAAKPLVPEIEQQKIPSDRLYGAVELTQRGWEVEFCDGRLTAIDNFFRKYTLSSINLATIRQALRCDTLVVKDNFSLPLTLLALVLRKKIIYLDSLFYIPKNKIRRFLLQLNLWFAPTVVSYSQYQINLWCREFNVKRSKFEMLPYTIDTDFYLKAYSRCHTPVDNNEPFILATGRDVGRDFKTLINAAGKAGLKVKLVTLPYLVPAEAANNPNVEIFQYLSYAELFELYARAQMVAIPLRTGIDYPSGIRAVFEAMLVGKATICTRTEILEEYIPASANALIYVHPEDEAALTLAIQTLMQDQERKQAIEKNGAELIKSSFSMNGFVNALEEMIRRKT